MINGKKFIILIKGYYLITAMKIIRYQKHPQGPRLWIGNQRVHHGASSIMAAALLLCFRRTRPLAPLMLMIALHDRHDWRYWFAPGDPQLKLKKMTHS